ncbi:M48 family metallopeptidase [Noviherbaspirillum sp. UKPF54]|uniref:M48 family metallopeptidase n=1 Tax=Noviherbaspirillum sp. UKPF54 TaxID=2601898 RepID=UPI0011B11501|nr:M48 family metallopeptidase [Noviherbaspirillum sp. UKPF54]QDZ28498.1 PDZ domain-containing protein [Noviherbaspirillum sp. UKPF54]
MAVLNRRVLPRLKRAVFNLRLPALSVALLLAACATTVSPPPGEQLPGLPGKPSAPAAPGMPGAPSVSSTEQEALRALVGMQDRLYRVAAPLLVNNTDLCRSHARNLLGFTAKNRYSYSADFTNAAQTLLGLGDRLQVVGVLPGGGAARAGVRRGDELVAVDDKPMPEGENAERQAAAILAPLVTGRTKVKMTVLRNGSSQTLTVPLTYACAYGIELGNTDNVTAYADGHRALITRGMLNYAASDEELAYVLAKELAHNALSHASRQRMNSTIGGIIDNLVRMHPDMSTMAGLAGVRPMPEDLDAMADKLSLYMLARAGYNIDRVAPFWQRLASQYPASVLNSYTAMHPSTAKRIAAMEKALKDIKTKQAAKRPLLP